MLFRGSNDQFHRLKLAKLRSFWCSDITARGGAFSVLYLRENALFVA